MWEYFVFLSPFILWLWLIAVFWLLPSFVWFNSLGGTGRSRPAAPVFRDRACVFPLQSFWTSIRPWIEAKGYFLYYSFWASNASWTSYILRRFSSRRVAGDTVSNWIWLGALLPPCISFNNNIREKNSHNNQQHFGLLWMLTHRLASTSLAHSGMFMWVFMF